MDLATAALGPGVGPTHGRLRGPRRREIARAREVVCDFLVGENVHGSTAESLEGWFMAYAMAARRGR